MCHSLKELETFANLIESTIDIDFYDKNNELRIKPSIDDDLSEISEQLDELEAKFQLVLRKVLLLYCKILKSR